MKQEAINSFNGGLNTDLNPLTTPNNVLTDCVNGTFLTFNGDELSLQNDAGNTTIDYNGSPVTLSNGFYPIGIKEYGGVLYIVSGKKPTDTSVLWVNGNSYSLNQIVRYGLNGEMIYYKSKISNNNHPLPYNSDEYWLIIGTLEDYNNFYGQVEFGSYPSPEFSGSTSLAGKILNYNQNNISDILYKSIVINEADFKSGRYVSFANNTLVLTYVSSYLLGFTYSPKFYKVKLWHQLNNGYLDLTDDIWKKYYEFKGTSIVNNHWFNDANFKYYCPSQFKGKLAISVEIEDLNSYGLVNVPSLIYDSSSIGTEYTFSLNVSYIGNGTISVPSVNVRMWLDDIEITNTLSNPYVATSNISEIIKTFDKSNKGKTLKYSISPNIMVNGITYYSEIPSDYITKYTITGSRTLTTSTDNVTFELNTFICYPLTSQKVYTSLILKNDSDNYIDNNLALSTIPYIFLEYNTAQPSNTEVIAYYSIVNEKPVIKTDDLINYPIMQIDSSILSSVESVDLTKTESDCGLVDVTIVLNVPVSSTANIRVSQNDQSVLLISQSNLKSLNYSLYSYIPFSITITDETGSYGGYISVNEEITTVYNSTNTINIALISDVRYSHITSPSPGNGIFNFNYIWGGSKKEYSGNYIPYNLYIDNIFVTPTMLSLANNGESYIKLNWGLIGDYWSSLFSTEPNSSTNPNIYNTNNPAQLKLNFINGSALVNNYLNISDNSQYTMYENMIFKNEYNFELIYN